MHYMKEDVVSWDEIDRNLLAPLEVKPDNHPGTASKRGARMGAQSIDPAPLAEIAGQDRSEPLEEGACEAEPEVHKDSDIQEVPDLRFSDPLIEDIVAEWRNHQTFEAAYNKMLLMAGARCRTLAAAELRKANPNKELTNAAVKTAGAKLLVAVMKEEPHPLSDVAKNAVRPMLMAMEPVAIARAHSRKVLCEMVRGLPIYDWAMSVRGIGEKTLASIVGEAGDLSKYRSHAAVWKRMGLAVIDGERQRKCKDKEKAAAHAYSPPRRAVAWNAAEAMIKAQGKDEGAGPYRLVYDARKAAFADRATCPAHANADARRYMIKRVLKHMRQAWRAVG